MPSLYKPTRLASYILDKTVYVCYILNVNFLGKEMIL
jgi:hypothetical protein